MAEPKRDIWAEWLLKRRSGGDAQAAMRALQDFLIPVRDRVLDQAGLQEGETLLDVGCGDGLIGFGALERTQSGRVIFSDISQDLLDRSRDVAQAAGVLERCRFVRAPADDLAAISDASVDVVTTRSVLIYVADKARAFAEFRRVLRPGGRVSLFEPINRLMSGPAPERFWGFDMAPVKELAEKLHAVYARLQPADSDPMLNFDERDLLAQTEAAGFSEVHLTLELSVTPPRDLPPWDVFLNTAGNPKIPTLSEAMQQALSPEERERFAAYLRPLYEAGRGVRRSALAYLWALR